MPRPWLVVVTGEPGSGKTTLGVRLATALHLPFLSRDGIRGGSLATAGLWTDQLRDAPPRAAAVDALVEVVETMASRGVTTVVEFVVTPDRREAWRRLHEAGRCLVILTECPDATARSARRDRADRLANRPEVLRALGFDSIDEYVTAPERDRIRREMQREFDVPLLRVGTEDGYDPPFDQIVDWVVDQTRS